VNPAIPSNRNEIPIRLGVVGLSNGNGHPYSWSAIINGYDPARMENCGFPVIPRYLEKERWPDARLRGAVVTHVWTQNESLSRSIAEAAMIPNIASNLEEMIGVVDAVLLARDDAENHLEMARPFLAAGLPVFIDKPLALNMDRAREILNLQQWSGQVFSCSATRFAEEFSPTSDQWENLGELLNIIAFTPKRWELYGIHAIEATARFLGPDCEIISATSSHAGEVTIVTVHWNSGVSTTYQALGAAELPIGLKLFGSRGCLDLFMTNTFDAFKQSLGLFLDSIRSRKSAISEREMLRAVRILELGMRIPK
jgi:hypothetical protein